MLESLEQSNIKRMSVEKPEKEQFYFDPEKEITPDDWNEIERKIKSSTSADGLTTTNAINMIYKAKILGRDFSHSVTKPEEMRDHLYFRILRNECGPTDISAYCNMSKLFPELRIVYDQNTLDHIEFAAHGSRNDWQWGNVATIVDSVDQETPGLPKGLRFGSNDLQQIELSLDQSISNKDIEGTHWNMPPAIYLAAVLKRFDPSFDVTRYDFHWNELAKMLKQGRDNWETYLSVAYNLYRLNASVKPDSEYKFPIPEQKQF